MKMLLMIGAVLVVPMSAHADITDRNLTLTGNAVIAGTVTIQGNPGGSNFALSLSSGLTLTNGGVKMNTGGYIQWADGTISTTAGMAAAGGNVPGGNAGGDLAGTYPNPTLAVNRVKTTGDTMTGQLTLSGSTLTISGNAFSVGGSTLVVSGGRIGILTSSPQTALDVNDSAQFGSGATKSTFTAAGLLKLTSSGIQWADGTTSTTSASGGSGGSNTLATRQICTSAGSGVYYSTTSTGVVPRQLRVRLLGGGGGGGGSEYAIGSTASATVFGSTSAYGGVGGATIQTTGVGGLGGNGGTSTNIVTRTPGNTGICEVRQVNESGANAVSGTGHGGAGGYYISGSRGGCWGGDGEIVEIMINSPASSYSYSVSTGAKGTTGDAYNGGKGSTGSITVDEFY